MPVLLFDGSSNFHGPWAKQWLAFDPNNRAIVPLTGAGTHKQIRDTIVKAVSKAGSTAFNELIFAVGHGGAAAIDMGTIDLSPALRMRLSRGTIGSRNPKGTEVFYDPFYTFVFHHANLKPKSDKTQDEEWVKFKDKTNLAGAKFRLERHAIYESIGAAIKKAHLTQVTFLTCNVGNATDFLKKIAIDWQVKVKAFKRFVVFQLNSPGTKRARVFFDGDKDGVGTNTPDGETNIPQTEFVIVGPPLVAPTPTGKAPPAKKKTARFDPWVDANDSVIHPNSPGGARGVGSFRTPGIVAMGPGNEFLPLPDAPAIRKVDPLAISEFDFFHA